MLKISIASQYSGLQTLKVEIALFFKGKNAKSYAFQFSNLFLKIANITIIFLFLGHVRYLLRSIEAQN